MVPYEFLIKQLTIYHQHVNSVQVYYCGRSFVCIEVTGKVKNKSRGY